MKKTKELSNSLIFLFLAVLFILPANAALNATGQIDPSNGFPQFYRDNNGLSLQQCLTDATGFADHFCFPPGLVPTFNKSKPIVFPANYPTEVFYWIIQARTLNVGQHGLGSATLAIQLESAFATLNPKGAVQPGQQITFLRINLAKLTDLVPGATYTITHPFGSFTVTADSTGSLPRATRFEDGCLGAPCDFTLLLPTPTTQIGPFLTWTGIPQTGLQLNADDPSARYIGDGITLHTITPGPNGAIFRIDGPGIGGVVNGIPVNTVQTNLWTVQGKMIISGVTLVVDGSFANSTGVNFPATYLLTVTNTGNALDTFDLAIQGPPGVVAFLNKSSIALNPGASGVMQLSVMSAAPGSYDVGVTATSAANPSMSAAITTTTTVTGITQSIAMLKPTESVTFIDTQGNVAWSSSNTTVGDIDPASGVFTAKLEGTTTITAAGAITDTAIVIVGTNRYTSQSLVTGFNTVIVPVQPDPVFTASKLLQLVTAQNTNVAGLSVVKWNATSQAFETFDPAAGVNDFPILAGDNYLVQVSADAASVSIVGTLTGIS